MIIAISLDQCEPQGNETEVYTQKVATLENESEAMRYAKDRDHIMLIDCDTGRILKSASVTVGDEG